MLLTGYVCLPWSILKEPAYPILVYRSFYVYRIAGNFRGVKIRYFRGQAGLDKILTLGVVHQNAMKLYNEANEIFTHKNHLWVVKTRVWLYIYQNLTP